MWKAPNRPKNEITQRLNSGIVTIYSVEDTAEPGYAPVEKLTEKVKLRYEEQRVGITRYYQAKQNLKSVERLIRCQRYNISTQDIAVTEDGKKYRIEQIQIVQNIWPECIDISLTRMVEK